MLHKSDLFDAGDSAAFCLKQTIMQTSLNEKKSGKHPTTKEAWPRDDVSRKCQALTCPPGKTKNKKQLLYSMEMVARHEIRNLNKAMRIAHLPRFHMFQNPLDSVEFYT